MLSISTCATTSWPNIYDAVMAQRAPSVGVIGMHVLRRSDTFPAHIAAVVDVGFAEAMAGPAHSCPFPGLAIPDSDRFGRRSDSDGFGWIPSNPAGGIFGVFYSLYGHFDPSKMDSESANPALFSLT